MTDPHCPIHGCGLPPACTCPRKKELVERVIDKIWFAGGLIAMMIVCTIGFAVASFLVSGVLLGFYWLLSRPLVWLFGW